jgi:glutathione synthase/RimK-type ligase-like ATP-grasp enzyme
MVLIYGIPSESPLALVIAELNRRAVEHLVISQRELAFTSIHLEDTVELSGYIKVANRKIDIGTIRSAYARPIDIRFLPEYLSEPGQSEMRDRFRESEAMFACLFNNLPGRVVNRPRHMWTNGSKPLQLQLIREAGLLVPTTIVSNDPAAVLSFQQKFGDLIYKSISGERSEVRRFSSKDKGILNRVAAIPVQFQQYVPGVDLRMHVVGERVFTCGIFHESDDYRYPGDMARPRLVNIEEVPEELLAFGRRVCDRLGLLFGGIDLRVHPNGGMYCFEINPSPGYSYYQREAKQPIAEAIVDVLTE